MFVKTSPASGRLPLLLMETSSIRKLLIAVGGLLLVVGVLWPWISKLGLGRLPGDIVIERENFRFYFPIVTMILVSLFLSLLLWLFRR
jgi:hypothetical protein